MLKLKARTSKVAKASKSRLNSLRRWVNSSRKHQLITVGAVLLLLVASVLAVSAMGDKSDKVVLISPEKSQQLKTLRIESNIPGIAMSGSPYCGSAELNKVTPYDCELKENQNETVITAPAEATIEGKMYVFQTWDGCSEGNEDRKVCKAKLDLESVTIISAFYEVVNKNTNNKAVTSKITCPAPEKFIILGPQAFAKDSPGQLVLYNSSKDFQQPTYAQFWSGNSCKEIPLSNGLTAVKDPEWGIHAGFGVASSVVVTRISAPTTKPVGGHNYLAVVDKSRFQRLKAVFRDDGKLMMDEASLKQIFDPSGDQSNYNSDSNMSWTFKGWVDSHTALFLIPWKISGPKSECQAFNFDNSTFIDAESYNFDPNLGSYITSSPCSW